MSLRQRKRLLKELPPAIVGAAEEEEEEEEEERGRQGFTFAAAAWSSSEDEEEEEEEDSDSEEEKEEEKKETAPPAPAPAPASKPVQSAAAAAREAFLARRAEKEAEEASKTRAGAASLPSSPLPAPQPRSNGAAASSTTTSLPPGGLSSSSPLSLSAATISAFQRAYVIDALLQVDDKALCPSTELSRKLGGAYRGGGARGGGGNDEDGAGGRGGGGIWNAGLWRQQQGAGVGGVAAAGAGMRRRLGAGSDLFVSSVEVEPDWQPAPTKIAGGYSMTLTSSSGATLSSIPVRSFTLESSVEYRAQLSFYSSFESAMDPGTLMHILQRTPYLLEGLLGASEMLTTTGQHEEANRVLKKALYTLQMALHPSFKPGEAVCRLPAAASSLNQTAQAVLLRYQQYARRIGAHRAAFELAKLLLQLEEPYSEAFDGQHRILLSLDLLALRAGLPLQLLRMSGGVPDALQGLAEGGEGKEEESSSPSHHTGLHKQQKQQQEGISLRNSIVPALLLPNWLLSRSIALAQLEAQQRQGAAGGTAATAGATRTGSGTGTGASAPATGSNASSSSAATAAAPSSPAPGALELDLLGDSSLSQLSSSELLCRVLILYPNLLQRLLQQLGYSFQSGGNAERGRGDGRGAAVAAGDGQATPLPTWLTAEAATAAERGGQEAVQAARRATALDWQSLLAYPFFSIASRLGELGGGQSALPPLPALEAYLPARGTQQQAEGAAAISAAGAAGNSQEEQEEQELTPATKAALAAARREGQEALTWASFCLQPLEEAGAFAADGGKKVGRKEALATACSNAELLLTAACSPTAAKLTELAVTAHASLFRSAPALNLLHEAAEAAVAACEAAVLWEVQGVDSFSAAAASSAAAAFTSALTRRALFQLPFELPPKSPAASSATAASSKNTVSMLHAADAPSVSASAQGRRSPTSVFSSTAATAQALQAAHAAMLHYAAVSVEALKEEGAVTIAPELVAGGAGAGGGGGADAAAAGRGLGDAAAGVGLGGQLARMQQRMGVMGAPEMAAYRRLPEVLEEWRGRGGAAKVAAMVLTPLAPALSVAALFVESILPWKRQERREEEQ